MHKCSILLAQMLNRICTNARVNAQLHTWMCPMPACLLPQVQELQHLRRQLESGAVSKEQFDERKRVLLVKAMEYWLQDGLIDSKLNPCTQNWKKAAIQFIKLKSPEKKEAKNSNGDSVVRLLYNTRMGHPYVYGIWETAFGHRPMRYPYPYRYGDGRLENESPERKEIHSNDTYVAGLLYWNGVAHRMRLWDLGISFWQFDKFEHFSFLTVWKANCVFVLVHSFVCVWAL